ncbi:MAG: two-component sensor histidine kinase [Pseudomonadales bacterium]|nr:two-component sensor histidine kinase [Pseudomonadales bacterium]
MLTREELLLEDLARAHRLKSRADALRRESELLLTGTRSVLEATSSEDMYRRMFEVFNNIIPYEVSFVLDQCEPGRMVCTSSTAVELLNSNWDVDPVFKRTVLGQPCVVYDITRQPAWGVHVSTLHSPILSALYCPFSGPDINAILVFCHSQKGFYIQNHAQIAERYKVFLEQLILSVHAKLQALETQSLKEQKEKVEQGLMQSEKMASLGLLAAGVAHEINNPVSFVTSNMNYIANCLQDLTQLNQYFQSLLAARASVSVCPTDLIAEMQEWSEEARIDETIADLDDIVQDCSDGLKRVHDIVSSLRSFVRTEDESKALDVNDCIESTLKLVANELKYHCEVQVNLGEVVSVIGNAGKLNQVITNLLINAGQAIDSNGKIVIASGTGCHPQRGDCVWFSISDNGSGIPTEKINRIFEPFYTTKIVGEGTGLGLSISYSIVEKMNGVIEVESQINKGACFKIWLPVNG